MPSDMPFWPELLRLLPVVWVVMEDPDGYSDDRSLGNMNSSHISVPIALSGCHGNRGVETEGLLEHMVQVLDALHGVIQVCFLGWGRG